MTTPVYGKRTIVLKGDWRKQNEDGAAGAAIKPGYLVQGVTTILPHATAGGNTPRSIALERDEMGLGIDSQYPDTPARSVDYAVGDTVKVWSAVPGDRALLYVASGVTLAEDDQVESAGNGTVRKLTNGTPLGRALEAVTATALTHVRIEIM